MGRREEGIYILQFRRLLGARFNLQVLLVKEHNTTQP
jgi:hypothetical protein